MGRRVCELFAGVGGFRLGLERAGWSVAWSNQWEPGRRIQHASDCYVRRFPDGRHVCQDISTIAATSIPNHDLLVGGFPCQDYSVATTRAQGLHGRKGVLWWEIRRILEAKRPPFLLLENVDRLLKSPASQRGRDFGVMLSCLNDLGYAVEWRTLNAADYSAPQRRRRVFIFGARSDTRIGRRLESEEQPAELLYRGGFFADEFPVAQGGRVDLSPETPDAQLSLEPAEVSKSFAFQFCEAGLARAGEVWSRGVDPIREKPVALRTVLDYGVGSEFTVPPLEVPRWKYLKGPKAEDRTARSGFTYQYTEGGLPFPDPLDRAARTVLTDEGGTSPSRFKHIIEDPSTGCLRVLTPREVERLNQFPDDWTDTGMPLRMRYFCMGNALVVGLVERMGRRLDRAIRIGLKGSNRSLPASGSRARAAA